MTSVYEIIEQVRDKVSLRGKAGLPWSEIVVEFKLSNTIAKIVSEELTQKRSYKFEIVGEILTLHAPQSDIWRALGISSSFDMNDISMSFLETLGTLRERGLTYNECSSLYGTEIKCIHSFMERFFNNGYVIRRFLHPIRGHENPRNSFPVSIVHLPRFANYYNPEIDGMKFPIVLNDIEEDILSVMRADGVSSIPVFKLCKEFNIFRRHKYLRTYLHAIIPKLDDPKIQITDKIVRGRVHSTVSLVPVNPNASINSNYDNYNESSKKRKLDNTVNDQADENGNDGEQDGSASMQCIRNLPTYEQAQMLLNSGGIFSHTELRKKIAVDRKRITPLCKQLSDQCGFLSSKATMLHNKCQNYAVISSQKVEENSVYAERNSSRNPNVTHRQYLLDQSGGHDNGITRGDIIAEGALLDHVTMNTAGNASKDKLTSVTTISTTSTPLPVLADSSSSLAADKEAGLNAHVPKLLVDATQLRMQTILDCLHKGNGILSMTEARNEITKSYVKLGGRLSVERRTIVRVFEKMEQDNIVVMDHDTLMIGLITDTESIESLKERMYLANDAIIAAIKAQRIIPRYKRVRELEEVAVDMEEDSIKYEPKNSQEVWTEVPDSLRSAKYRINDFPTTSYKYKMGNTLEILFTKYKNDLGDKAPKYLHLVLGRLASLHLGIHDGGDASIDEIFGSSNISSKLGVSVLSNVVQVLPAEAGKNGAERFIFHLRDMMGCMPLRDLLFICPLPDVIVRELLPYMTIDQEGLAAEFIPEDKVFVSCLRRKFVSLNAFIHVLEQYKLQHCKYYNISKLLLETMSSYLDFLSEYNIIKCVSEEEYLGLFPHSSIDFKGEKYSIFEWIHHPPQSPWSLITQTKCEKYWSALKANALDSLQNQNIKSKKRIADNNYNNNFVNNAIIGDMKNVIEMDVEDDMDMEHTNETMITELHPLFVEYDMLKKIIMSSCLSSFKRYTGRIKPDVKEIESTTAELRAFEYLDPFEVNGESFYEVFDKLRNDMSSGVCWCHPYRNVMHIDWREYLNVHSKIRPHGEYIRLIRKYETLPSLVGRFFYLRKYLNEVASNIKQLTDSYDNHVEYTARCLLRIYRHQSHISSRFVSALDGAVYTKLLQVFTNLSHARQLITSLYGNVVPVKESERLVAQDRESIRKLSSLPIDVIRNMLRVFYYRGFLNYHEYAGQNENTSSSSNKSDAVETSDSLNNISAELFDNNESDVVEVEQLPQKPITFHWTRRFQSFCLNDGSISYASLYGSPIIPREDLKGLAVSTHFAIGDFSAKIDVYNHQEAVEDLNEEEKSKEPQFRKKRALSTDVVFSCQVDMGTVLLDPSKSQENIIASTHEKSYDRLFKKKHSGAYSHHMAEFDVQFEKFSNRNTCSTSMVGDVSEASQAAKKTRVDTTSYVCNENHARFILDGLIAVGMNGVLEKDLIDAIKLNLEVTDAKHILTELVDRKEIYKVLQFDDKDEEEYLCVLYQYKNCYSVCDGEEGVCPWMTVQGNRNETFYQILVGKVLYFLSQRPKSSVTDIQKELFLISRTHVIILLRCLVRECIVTEMEIESIVEADGLFDDKVQNNGSKTKIYSINCVAFVNIVQ